MCIENHKFPARRGYKENWNLGPLRTPYSHGSYTSYTLATIL